MKRSDDPAVHLHYILDGYSTANEAMWRGALLEFLFTMSIWI